MELPPDWNEFIGLLISHRVRYLVVGAHAMAAAGRPRATQDIDFWVEPEEANAKRLVAALADFGFGELAPMWLEFTKPLKMVTLGRPPLRIDVMTSIAGVTFAEGWQGRTTVPVGEHSVEFLGRAQLLLNKRSTGRAKDRLDVELLTEGRD